MAQVPQARFDIGTRVFTRDGRTGIVQSADFAPAVNGFRYILEGIADIFEEDDLLDIPFGQAEPLSPLDALRAGLEFALRANPGLDVRFWVGGELGVPSDVLDDTDAQAAGGTLDDELRFWAARGFTIPGGPTAALPEPIEPLVEPPAVALVEAADILAEVDLRIAQAVSAIVENSIIARDQLEKRVMDFTVETLSLTNRRFALRESVVTDVLNDIENSLSGLEQAAMDTAGIGLLDLLGLVGQVVSNPLEFLLEKSGDAIQREIIDGLTR